MVETANLHPNPNIPGELLRAQKLYRADVMALSRLTGRPFIESTFELLGLNLNGSQITEARGSGRYTRMEAALMVLRPLVFSTTSQSS